MKRIIAIAAASLLASCAVAPINPDYSLIDGGSGGRNVNYATYQTDYAECAALADQTSVGGNAAVGAGFGALIGAVVGGAICGRNCSQQMAAFGAGYGGTSGAIGGVVEQQQALRACLRGRGYNVIR